MHGLDPQLASARCGETVERLAAEPDLTGIRLLEASQNLDHRALPSAVVADQRHDLAGAHGEGHVGESVDTPEPFRDPSHRSAIPSRDEVNWLRHGGDG